MSLTRARELVSIADYPQAESLLQRHLRKSPSDPDANNLMCYILAHTGRMDQALFYAERAAAGSPNPHTLTNLGNTLLNLGHESKAIDTLRRALALENHQGATAAHALAFAFNSTRRYTAARDLCHGALSHQPDNIPLTLDLADALQNLAHADQAVALLQSLDAKYPGAPLITGNLAAAMNYAPNLSPTEIHHAHVDFAKALSRNLPAPNPPPITDLNPDRPIRLGLIIPDLTRHSVAYFIRPLLERLDPSRFTLFIYYTGAPKGGKGLPPGAGLAPDWPIANHTARLVAWEPLPRLDALVRADRLDMLIDLCGMSSSHRLQLMHLKPASIQLTYAGYPNTTGLPSIDYRIVDSHTDPEGADSLATETLLRLDPCFLCYTPPTDAPAMPSPSSPRSGQVTFGSFNHLPKLNAHLITLWTRILNSIPNSRLLLKAAGLQLEETRAEIQSLFSAAGLDASRLDLLPPTQSRADHLNTYSRIDIALDPFPYHGTTTTCEALWMGVPVITRAGNTHVSRVGVSLLRNLNLSELIADSDDDYVSLAGSLATDRARLTTLRSTLRERLQGSSLCDEPAFAARFQSLLRSIWADHCKSPDALPR